MSVDASNPDCRVMFYGNLVHIFCGAGTHKQLRLYKVRLDIDEAQYYLADPVGQCGCLACIPLFLFTYRVERAMLLASA